MLLVYPGPVAILRGTALKRGWGPELAFVQRLPMTYDETKVPVADRLDFLGRGNTWKAELCTDGENGRAVASVRRVSGGDWFPVKMDKAGGFTLILTRESRAD